MGTVCLSKVDQAGGVKATAQLGRFAIRRPPSLSNSDKIVNSNMSLVAGDESISPSELKAIAKERTGGGALLLADI